MAGVATAPDPWAICRRPPVVIPPDEADAIERQWAIYACMTAQQRLGLGLQMSALAAQQRRDRLRRRFPDADERGISWAVIREILELEPGTAPVTE